jgi:hypothetical protein
MLLQFRQVKVLGMLATLCLGPGKQKLWQPALRRLQDVAVRVDQQCTKVAAGDDTLAGPAARQYVSFL